MIDFLKEHGISEDTIKEISSNEYQEYLYDLNCNKEQCIKIIDYLRTIGIKNIDNLLINELDLFCQTKNEIEYAFSQCGIDKLVNLINEDYEEIEIIYDYL
jgi:hypothetical protein